MVESDYSTFKARLSGTEWPATEWKPFAEVTPEMVTANYRRIQGFSLQTGGFIR